MIDIDFLKKTALGRLLKNSGILLTGNFAASILALASFAFTARALGPELFGILVTIQTFVIVIDRLINFQSWQALIKYGAEALKEKSQDNFKGLIKFGLALDFSTALAGTILALISIQFLAQWHNWDESLSNVSQIYCFVILFNLTGTPTAILRLFDRFKTYVIPQIFAQLFKFIATLIAFILKADFSSFLLIWVFADIINYSLMFFLGFNLLQKKKFHGILKIPLKQTLKKYKNIITFVITTNLNTSIRMCSRELDLLIIGGILGMPMVGLFKVAKQFAEIVAKIFNPLYEAIYPELTKLVAAKQIKEFYFLIKRSAVYAGAGAGFLWIGFMIFGETIIFLTVGDKFLSVYQTMIYYMFAIVIAIATFPLSPAVLALGKYNWLLISLTIATIAYLVCLPFLLLNFGLNGAAVAYIIFYIFWSILMIVQLNTKGASKDTLYV